MTAIGSRLISAWQLIAKRSLAHWRVLLSVILGVLLASSIMSGTIIYFDALRNLALDRALAKHPDLDLDILIEGDRGPTNREEYLILSRLIDQNVKESIGFLINGILHAGKTPTMFLTSPGKEEEAGKYNSRSYFTGSWWNRATNKSYASAKPSHFT